MRVKRLEVEVRAVRLLDGDFRVMGGARRTSEPRHSSLAEEDGEPSKGREQCYRPKEDDSEVEDTGRERRRRRGEGGEDKDERGFRSLMPKVALPVVSRSTMAVEQDADPMVTSTTRVCIPVRQ